MELLLVIRNAGRQGGDVPVQMAVPLLTTEGVEVSPLNPENILDGKGDGPHEKHEPRVLALVQLTDDMLDMGLGRDEDFAGKGGPPVEKGNVLLIFVDDVVRIAGIPGKKGTDETWGGFSEWSKRSATSGKRPWGSSTASATCASTP